jgi:dinuclear metal center YbgI/SA1388 family protein
MRVEIDDIISIMERIAPRHLAEKWDNPGLQTGDPGWPVKKIITALDPLPEVIRDAISKKANMLITHHPLIFKPLSSIDYSSPIGKTISASYQNQLAIFSAHTNLDSTDNGLNDILGNIIGLKNMYPLVASAPEDIYKLVFFIPPEHKKTVLTKLFEADAGVIGNYTCCSFSAQGKGTFTPGPESSPHTGSPGVFTSAGEERVELVVKGRHLEIAIHTLQHFHPYETPAFDIYPLKNTDNTRGIGRIGELPEAKTVLRIAEHLKTVTGKKLIKAAGNLQQPIKKVALCTGSGSGLFSTFLKSGAGLFISGDLHYHDARTAEETNKAIIDLGHFTSEKTAMGVFTENLKKAIAAAGLDVQVEESFAEHEPFEIV